MIDGAKIACFDLPAPFWTDCKLLDFGLIVSEKTGELLSQTKEAKARGLTFRVTKQANGGGFCSVLGSLHRYKNNGGKNCDAFTFTDLQNVIKDLQTKYNINPQTSYIQNLEIGVNIPLEYSPEVLIKAAICHKGRAFGSLTDNRHRVGKACEYEAYKFKIYDKSKQAEAAGNVLRFEVKAKRQRILEPYGVRTLSDLNDKTKCFSLLGLLLEKIENTIFYDFSFKGNGLSEAKRLKFEQYSNPNTWENKTKYGLIKAKQKYKDLQQKYNVINWQKWAIKKTTETWLDLLGLQAHKGQLLPQILEAAQAQKGATFAMFNCLLAEVAKNEKTGNVLKVQNTPRPAVSKRRINLMTKTPCFCVTCGRDISNQKKGSRFCSELVHGKDARKCRNKESNKRLSFKRKIKQAMDKKKFLLITYKHNGADYADILSPQEISVTREWLDKVQSVEIITEPRKTLKNEAAKQYLKTITQSNNETKTK